MASRAFEFYLSRLLIDTRNVHPRGELDGWGVIRIVGAAMDVNAVYPVLVDTLIFLVSLIYLISQDDAKDTNVRGSQDSTVPVAHHHILAIGKTI